MAKACGLSPSSVRRIWRAVTVHPHHAERLKLFKDPLCVERVLDIVGLYIGPQDKVLALCVDEKMQAPALVRRQPIPRYDTSSLLEVLEPRAMHLPVHPEVVAAMEAYYRSLRFPAFLSAIDDAVPEDLAVHLVLDKYPRGKIPMGGKRRRFHLHVTPKGASWAKLFEHWFAVPSRVRRGSAPSRKRLEITAVKYRWEQDSRAEPFVWTKTADEVLASIGRMAAPLSR
jgi:hypothetical protein